MIHLTAQTSILLAYDPVDFRKQFDGLIAICSRHLRQNPRSGTRFVFINRARTMIRILTYDGSGFWLATKRLSRGRFSAWPSTPEAASTIDAKALIKIIHSENCQNDPVSVTYGSDGKDAHEN